MDMDAFGITTDKECHSQPTPGLPIPMEPPRMPAMDADEAAKVWRHLNKSFRKYDLAVFPPDAAQINDVLEWQDILNIFGGDIVDCAERDGMREEIARLRRHPQAICEPNIGKSLMTQCFSGRELMHVCMCEDIIKDCLHNVLYLASTTDEFGGITHDIPIIVHSSVEEILRRGISHWQTINSIIHM